ncbi:MAG: chromate resistance protein ChrB domain-containing protein [Candidatus Bathyarchaeia archaeon]
MKWVTREYVHVDRTACPWLIKKFIDSEAEFIFVPTQNIEDAVKTSGAIPFDAPGAKLGHREGKCSFEAIIEEYGLKDTALHTLAKIVHAADTKDAEAAPEGAGLSAVMIGIRLNSGNDFEAVEKAREVYEALYAYSKSEIVKEKYEKGLEGLDGRQQRAFIKEKMISEFSDSS